jgi:hypothetical protein
MEGEIVGGSYYMNGENKMYLREGEGSITIVDNGGIVTITGDNLGILNLEALISSGGATWSVLETPGSVNVTDATKL